VLLGFIQPLIPVSFVNVWAVLSIGVFLWQVVGTLRSADRSLKDSGNMLGVYLSYFLIFITTALTLVQVADALASKHQPEPYEIKIRTLPVLSNEGLMQVDGLLDWELFAAFKNTLENNPDIQGVQLNSSGGFVFVARAMALRIQEKKLNTHVETQCYSACTVTFLAGERRTMAADAEIGFHRYDVPMGNEQGVIKLSDELEVDRQYFLERGMSKDFAAQVFNAEHTDIWVPSVEELVEGGVLTDVDNI